MSVQGNPYIVHDSSLLVCLDAANPRSYPGTGTTWYDLSGNNANGTKGGSQSPTYPQFNSGGWFTFSGGVLGDNYSRFSLTTPTLNEISVFAWHYATQSDGHVLRHSTDSFQIGPVYAAGTAYNNIYCLRQDTLNQWISDSLTFTGTNLTGYRNGLYYSSASRTSTTIAGGTLHIGARDDLYYAHYVGNIACVLIYSRALSGDEILQIHNATKTRFGL